MAEDTGAPGEGDAPAEDTATEDTQTDDLGEGGRKALQEERSARRKAEKETKALADRLAKLEEANQSEAEKAIAAAREEGKREALTAANARILRAEISAVAAGKLADPSDALSFLDLSEFEIGDDGEVDRKAIASAIDALVKQKPYLAADAKSQPGAGGGGARPDSASAKDDPLLAAIKAKIG